MQLYYFRAYVPNFGDELSQWLMPRVFPNLFDDAPDQLFLGIGSILFDFYPQAARKIVFGSGFGGYTKPPKIDENWHIYCVRGPVTAQMLGLSPATVAGDAAILVNRYRPSSSREGGVAFMPHYDNLRRGHWQQACALAGIDFINPTDPVANVMDRIQASRLVLSEAMHGVIVADALRVPWVAVEPIDAGHHMKWNDWAGALDLAPRFQPLAPSSMRELKKWRRSRRAVRLTAAGNGPSQGRSGSYWDYPERVAEILLKAADPVWVHIAANSLRRAALQEPMLSSDRALDRALDKLQTNADRIKLDYAPMLARQRAGG